MEDEEWLEKHPRYGVAATAAADAAVSSEKKKERLLDEDKLELMLGILEMATGQADPIPLPQAETLFVSKLGMSKVRPNQPQVRLGPQRSVHRRPSFLPQRHLYLWLSSLSSRGSGSEPPRSRSCMHASLRVAFRATSHGSVVATAVHQGLRRTEQLSLVGAAPFFLLVRWESFSGACRRWRENQNQKEVKTRL